MAMQMNAMMIEGDHLEALTAWGLSAMGYRTLGAHAADVPGALLQRCVDEALHASDHPLTCVGLCVVDGWTLVVDQSGELVEDLEAWLAFSARLQTRIITAARESGRFEFAVMDAGRVRRLVSLDDDEEAVRIGEPMSIEALWSADMPAPEEVVESLSCISIDLQRANATSLFELVSLRPDLAAREVSASAAASDALAKGPAEFPDELAGVFPNNVVQLISAAC